MKLADFSFRTSAMLCMVSVPPNVLRPQRTHGFRQYLPIKLILKVSPAHSPYQIHKHLIHSPHPHLIYNSCTTFSLQTGRNPEIWGIASGKKVVCPGQVQGIIELFEVIDRNIRDAKSALQLQEAPSLAVQFFLHLYFRRGHSAELSFHLLVIPAALRSTEAQARESGQ